MVRRRRGWSSSTPPSPSARLTRCSTTSTLLNSVTMFMTRCWKQEEVKVVEVELLPLFVQLFLVSCLRQLSWGKHRHSHLLLISLFPRLASLAVSHQNTIPLFFVFLSFVIWLYDCITDMVGDFFSLIPSVHLLIFYILSFFVLFRVLNFSISLHLPNYLQAIIFTPRWSLRSCGASNFQSSSLTW